MAVLPVPLRWAAVAALLTVPLCAVAAGLPQSIPDIANLSIEELAHIEITSVSRKPERLADAAASVFVITADDIRRAGAATLPEALRLAPNLHVGQVSNYAYNISARGLNGNNNTNPNKLLVMIDGRSIYSPMHAGVLWDQHDLLLEDIERIEVISGPGGTLWGVNAVNGVINIITRAARASEGSLAVLGAGERGTVAGFRYGAATGPLAWRAYAKQSRRRHTETASGALVDDADDQTQAGLRADWGGGPDQFSIHLSAYRGDKNQPKPGSVVTGARVTLGTISASGAALVARWQRALAGGATLELQGYLDHSKRSVPPWYAETLDLADLQLQHHLAPAGAHRLVWGANVRTSWDKLSNSAHIAFLPAKLSQTWLSVFAQDEIALTGSTRLTLGARAERNDYTGTELLPTVRLAWSATPRHAFWGGISRTVRAPARLDVDTFVPGKPPFILGGGPAVRSEVAKVIEMGYRGQPVQGLSASLTVFHNRYDHLRTQELTPARTSVVFDSKMEGKASGIEAWGSAQLAPYWRVSAGATALHQTFWLKPGSNNLAGPGSAAKDPAHTVQLRSTFTLPGERELEFALRKVAALDNPAVPGYVAVDARFGWRISRQLELSVSGQNLNGSHAENGPLATRSDIPRSVGVKLVWQG